MKILVLSLSLLTLPSLLAQAQQPAIATTPAAPNTLESLVTPIAQKHKGKIAVAVKHLGTGESFSLNGDVPMPTASLIKMQIMVEAMWQAEEKKVDLAKTLTLTKDDKVPGSGVLTDHFSDGVTFPLRDAIRLMIVFSDNTATNMVLDAVGIKNVNDRMEKLGFPHSKINAKVYKGSVTSVDPARTKQFGLGSTTANESLRMIEMIHGNKVVTPEACKKMMEHLFANDDKEMMVRFLPNGTKVAHKTGAVSNARTEAGIMFVPNPKDKKAPFPIALCVLTTENEDKRWILDNEAQLVIARIAEAVYNYYLK